MSRRCSHCGNNGHNSRTCLDSRGGFKLFGVRLSSECCAGSSSPGGASECSSSSALALRKSVSMGNLCNYNGSEGGASSSVSRFEQHDGGDPGEGYASDDLVHTNSTIRERKKGVPWTEEEHRFFLRGLQTLGKGDWRGISRNFVTTRTPTQVASHAQKYFLRRNNLNKRRRRSSLFDITSDWVSKVLEEPVLEETGCEDPDVNAELSLGQSIPHGRDHVFEVSRLAVPSLSIGNLPATRLLPLGCVVSGVSGLLRVSPKSLETQDVRVTDNGSLHQLTDFDAMEVVPELVDIVHGTYNASQVNVVGQALLWPGEYIHGMAKPEPMDGEFKIVKPIPIVPISLQKVEETLKIPQLTISMARRIMEPTPLSFQLLSEGSRHSAFQVTVPKSGSREVDGQGSLNSAISVP